MTTLPVDYTPNFLTETEATSLFESLKTDLPWNQKTGSMWGKPYLEPRLTCWIGETAYVYSGITNVPTPWTPELSALRIRLEEATGAQYSSCLANQYRDGSDSVSWHSDDEPGLGPSPTIASISLGATRAFKLRHEATRTVTDFSLGHGDLIVMRDESQSDYRHSVPKRAHAGPRINLTFRLFG